MAEEKWWDFQTFIRGDPGRAENSRTRTRRAMPAV
jgi:hypothetical protein